MKHSIDRWRPTLLAFIAIAATACSRETPVAPDSRPASAPAPSAEPASAPAAVSTPTTRMETPKPPGRGTAIMPGPDPEPQPLDLSLTPDETTRLFDDDFNPNDQYPLQGVFGGKAAPRERRFSISGDLFWDEEMLKQEQVNYLDAIKGGEVSVEIKTR